MFCCSAPTVLCPTPLDPTALPHSHKCLAWRSAQGCGGLNSLFCSTQILNMKQVKTETPAKKLTDPQPVSTHMAWYSLQSVFISQGWVVLPTTPLSAYLCHRLEASRGSGVPRRQWHSRAAPLPASGSGWDRIRWQSSLGWPGPWNVLQKKELVLNLSLKFCK